MILPILPDDVRPFAWRRSRHPFQMYGNSVPGSSATPAVSLSKAIIKQDSQPSESRTHLSKITTPARSKERCAACITNCITRCRVVEGEALDVAVDIRAGSPNFGKWAAVLLSAAAQNQIYIPRGFAHGFLALTERVQFLYKCSDFYDAADEHTILWSDPQIALPWSVPAPLVSEKDSRAPALADLPRTLLPPYAPK
jgi:hypothetical protein